MPEDRPTFGFNADVSYRGQTYHLQTESSGDPARPAIHSLVYQQGALMRKVSSSYADLLAEEPGRIEERVRRQHLDVLARIKRGEIP